MFTQRYLALKKFNLGYDVKIGDVVDVEGLRLLTINSLVNGRFMTPITEEVAAQHRANAVQENGPQPSETTEPTAKRRYPSQAELRQQEQMKGAR